MKSNNHEGTPGSDTEADDGLRPTESFRTAGASRPGTASIPESIGQYRILSKLGEGGMGVVYEAEQQSPRRKVAVKVVRGGQFVDEHRVRMFQREADTLARLKHPNIAAIYESGRTEDGQHFFAMELVRGQTLETYLKGRPKSVTPQEVTHRLGLFRNIADAVHYAHQRGVVHRDVKPSNVIVTEEAVREDGDGTPGVHLPEIKILDFGLARITEGDLAATTMATEMGVIKGTLPYMSPEQARGIPEEIDVRTDVYALGVMLYELLTGSQPYDLSQKPLAEAVRVICEDPPKPLKQTWSGVRRPDHDIETILGKALEKSADRRYASAAALSEDIGRYLTSQPILARPPSTTYQLRKFAARNRTLVLGVVATLVVLIAGVVVSTSFGLREARQRRQTESARLELAEVVEFQADMLQELDVQRMGSMIITDLRERVETNERGAGSPEAEIGDVVAAFDHAVRDVNATNVALRVIDENILDRAVTTIEERFANEPLTDARLRRTVGETYHRLGSYERAELQYNAALAIRERLQGEDASEALEVSAQLAELYGHQGRYDESEAQWRAVVEAQSRVLGVDHPDTLESRKNLAGLLTQLGRFDEAEPLYLEVLEVQHRVFGEESTETALTNSALAAVYYSLGQYEMTESLAATAYEQLRASLGPDHLNTLFSMNQLAVVYQARGRFDAAEELLLEAVERQRRVFGDDHQYTLTYKSNLAGGYIGQDRWEDAERLFLEVIEAQKRTLGVAHRQTIQSINNLAYVYRKQGRFADAESSYMEIVEHQKRIFGPDNPRTLVILGNIGDVYFEQGEVRRAEPYYVEALEGIRRVLPRQHPVTGYTLQKYGVCLTALERFEEAEALLIEAHSITAESQGATRQKVGSAVGALIDLYEAWDRPDEAARWRTMLPDENDTG